MKLKFLLLWAGLLFVGTGRLAADYTQQIELARADRIDRLTQANGWLALVSLPSLPPGISSIGQASDNRIVLATGPAHLGVLQVEDRVTFSPAPGAGVRVNGEIATGVVELIGGDRAHRATLVSAGTMGFYLVEENNRKRLHVRDVARPQLVYFPGVDYFPIDPAWRIEADWIPSEGRAVFTHDGKAIQLVPFDRFADKLLFVFSDTTGGRETYPMRFLEADLPQDGKLVLDFNLAVNPPCAFSDLAACPLPPAQNRLPFAVRAGEKAFHDVSRQTDCGLAALEFQQPFAGGVDGLGLLREVQADVAVFGRVEEHGTGHGRHADLLGHPAGKLDVVGVAEG